MKLKRGIIYIGLVFFVMSITGCVYLRLLEVKRQLYAFDSYFEINERHGLTLVFFKPVLLTKDILWLMKQAPTSEEETDQGKVWRYVFEKQYRGPKDEQGDFDIPVVMLFQEGKLREVRFPERFLTVLSKPLLIRMFQSIGQAQINKWKRATTSKFQGKSPLEIPRKQYVVKVLGRPFNTENSNSTSKFIYKYNLKKTTSNSESKDFNVWTEFTFQSEDERLLKMEGNLGSIVKMSIDFSVEKSGDDKNGDSR